MALYQLAAADGSLVSRLLDDGSTEFISKDVSSRHWREYQDWLAAGNTPDPYVPPSAPPPSCQLWQLQAVMTPAQWAAVQSAVANLNNPAVTAFMAHGTNVIPANSKTLVQLAAAIGLTADQAAALVAQASAVSIP